MEVRWTPRQIEQDRISAKTMAPEMRDGRLVQGFLRFSLAPNQNFRISTTRRTRCEAALLVVRHADGSTDGIISHFDRRTGLRMAHAELFEELDIPLVPEDTTYALLLVSTWKGRIVRQEEFERIKGALACKNKGIDPDIVEVDFGEIFVGGGRESEIVFTQQVVGDGYDQVVEVTNSDYRKKFSSVIK